MNINFLLQSILDLKSFIGFWKCFNVHDYFDKHAVGVSVITQKRLIYVNYTESKNTMVARNGHRVSWLYYVRIRMRVVQLFANNVRIRVRRRTNSRIISRHRLFARYNHGKPIYCLFLKKMVCVTSGPASYYNFSNKKIKLNDDSKQANKTYRIQGRIQEF